MRDVVDSDFLFQASIGAPDEEENASEDSDAHQRPIEDLQPCEFGKNGIPAVQYEGETDCVTSFLPTLFPDLSCSLRGTGILCPDQ